MAAILAAHGPGNRRLAAAGNLPLEQWGYFGPDTAATDGTGDAPPFCLALWRSLGSGLQKILVAAAGNSSSGTPVGDRLCVVRHEVVGILGKYVAGERRRQVVRFEFRGIPDQGPWASGQGSWPSMPASRSAGGAE